MTLVYSLMCMPMVLRKNEVSNNKSALSASGVSRPSNLARLATITVLSRYKS